MLRPDTLAMTAALALLTALGPLSTDMYLPSLPSIAGALTASASEVQLTLSAFLVGFAAGQIVHGPIADRLGRKPVLLAGIGIYVAASAACAAAVSVEWLIVARFFQALGASGPIVLARSIARDLYEGPRAGQELARMGSIMGLVPAAAPVIGGLLETAFGWRASFLGAMAFGLFAAWLVHARLPETIRRKVEEPFTFGGILAGFGAIWAHRPYRPWAAIVALTYGGLFAFISGSSFVLQGLYGLTEVVYGFAFGVCALAYVGGTLIGGRLVRRVGIAATARVGVTLLALGGGAMLVAALVHSGHPLEIVVPMMVYMVGVGVGLPQTQAGALMPFPDRAGTASSLTGFLQMAFAAAIGIGVGHSLGSTPVPLAAFVAALGTAALIVERASARVRAG